MNIKSVSPHLIVLFLFMESGIMAQPLRNVTADGLKSWVGYLASDEMRGRANGSPEMIKAAGWLEERLKEFGVRPLLDGNSYIQNYSYKSRSGAVEERNVIGVIEGADPALKDQYIVLTAHFDHVGVRKNNTPDTIYNGADDNAAGTCTLLGIARNIQLSGKRPGRSILIAIFSGEENGMRGSRHFVANSPVELRKIFINMNFEMTGHSESYGRKNYYMTGTHLSNLDDVISKITSGSGFTLIDTIRMARALFNASDNIAFSRIPPYGEIATGIPSGTFATTTMARYIHSPDDEPDLFDFENMADLVNHFSDIVLSLSYTREEINWTDPKYIRIK